MTHRTWSRAVAYGMVVTLLAGCATSPRNPPASVTTPVGATRHPTAGADSPLAACVNPAPAMPKPVDTAVAHDFADGRVQVPLSLDGGTFRAVPAPADARPRVTPSVALCNLLAGVTAQNFSVADAAEVNGLSFGLGVVTVADTVLKTGSRSYIVGGQAQTATLKPYHTRLAWIAVINPEVGSSCPASRRETGSPARRPPNVLPSYQILAFDADTGADGIIYSAITNANCSMTNQPASVAPSAELVSVPWTLTSRGPSSQSATISYPRRSCDQASMQSFAGTGGAAVFADSAQPGLVRVNVERLLTTCGPPAPTALLLRSSTLTTVLPQHLVHAPVGAFDIPS